MQFKHDFMTNGSTAYFRNLSLNIADKDQRSNDISNRTYDTVLGAEYILGGSVNFQLRATYYDHMITNCGAIKKALQLFVKIQGRDDQNHAVAVSSKTLNVCKYFKVQPASKAAADWFIIYDQMVCIESWKFDLSLTLMCNGVNEQTAGRLMASLYADKDTTDVELVGYDGTVRAHGYVLSAASEFMRAAFFGEFQEARDKRLNVPDATVAALKLIKQFAYTGYVDAEPVMMVELLPLASRFMMDELCCACTASVADLQPQDLIPLLQMPTASNQMKRPFSQLMIENKEEHKKQPKSGDGDGK